VLSQDNKHQQALIYGEKAVDLCNELVEGSLILCRLFVNKLKKERMKKEKRKIRGNITHTDKSDSPYDK
jgi:hypothetical protein